MSDGGEKTYLLDHLGWRDIPLSSRAMPVCTGCLWQRIRAWTESIMAGTPASVNGKPGCTQFHHPARSAEGQAQGFRSVRSWARSESTLSAFRLVRNLRRPCAWPSAARACVNYGAARFYVGWRPHSQSLCRWA